MIGENCTEARSKRAFMLITGSQISKNIIQIMPRTFAQRATFDRELISLLAAASANVYDNVAGKNVNERYMGRAFEVMFNGGKNDIGYALLKIRYAGDYQDKYIFAIRGCASFKNVRSDLSFMSGGSKLKKDIGKLDFWIKQVLAAGVAIDYLAGHGLGGTIAEALCTRHGIPGASFGCMGPYSDSNRFNLTDNKNVAHGNVQWMAYINEIDPLAILPLGGTSYSETHIMQGAPAAQEFFDEDEYDIRSLHGSKWYCLALGQLDQTKIDQYHEEQRNSTPGTKKKKAKKQKSTTDLRTRDTSDPVSPPTTQTKAKKKKKSTTDLRTRATSDPVLPPTTQTKQKKKKNPTSIEAPTRTRGTSDPTPPPKTKTKKKKAITTTAISTRARTTSTAPPTTTQTKSKKKKSTTGGTARTNLNPPPPTTRTTRKRRTAV